METSKRINYLSLEKIVNMLLGVHMDKFYQMADWRIRPLPQGMLDYARGDSRYLIAIFSILHSYIEFGEI